MGSTPAAPRESLGVPRRLLLLVGAAAMALIAVAGVALQWASEASVAPDSMRLVVEAADTAYASPSATTSATPTPSADHDGDDD